MNGIKAIGFDMDDTLYDRDLIYQSAYDLVTRYVVKSNVEFEKFNLVYQECSLVEYQKFMSGEKTFDEYQLDRFVDAFKELNIDIDIDQAKIFQAIYDYQKKHVQLRQFMEKILLDLVERDDIKIFLLTNGPGDNQRKKIKNLKLDKFFNDDEIFISGDLSVSKPDRKIFDYVSEKLNLDPSSIVYVGDNLENDVIGAIEAGWRAIYYDYETRNDNENKDIPTFSEDKDLYEYIMKHLGR
ncbi:HAD family hydrolase [Facklamia hominis]|uniref:HAD family hydrolase n=1 Tax=Facklamia hominis TaxID=178214 RepID=UPI00288A3020|nr:HAD family hydrolase [Facklamia hominis]